MVEAEEAAEEEEAQEEVLRAVEQAQREVAQPEPQVGVLRLAAVQPARALAVLVPVPAWEMVS